MVYMPKTTTLAAWLSRTLGWLSGDLAMLSVVSLAKKFIEDPSIQYFSSVVIVAIGAYCIFGWPQLRLWDLANYEAEANDKADFRLNWALRLLNNGGVPLFILASVIEGPIAVAWYMGRVNHPKRKLLTWISAWLLSLFWVAIYFWWGLKALLIVFIALIIIVIYSTFKIRQDIESNDDVEGSMKFKPTNDRVMRNWGLVSEREQRLIYNAKVAIAGVGGDGGLIAEQLARLGVVRFALADPEVFEISNLNRQNCSDTSTLGRNKATVLAECIISICPEAEVTVFAEGINSENIERFMEGATIVVDETEITSPVLAIMLARAARILGIPVITGFNIGFGCLTTTFQPDSMTLEKYLGLSEEMSLDTIENTAIPLSRWLPRLPTYSDGTLLAKVMANEIPIPSVAPGVSLAAGAVTTEVFNQIVQRRKPIVAPHCWWIDSLENKARIIKRPSLSFAVSVIWIKARTLLGLNEQM